MSELPGEGPVRHNCPWPGCSRRVLPWFWGCAPHWAMVPKVLASEFLKTRKDGVETQPIEHHMILERINNWTKTNAVADEQRPSTATGEVTGFTAGFCDDGSIMLFWAKEGEYLVLGPTEEQVLRRLLGRR